MCTALTFGKGEYSQIRTILISSIIFGLGEFYFFKGGVCVKMAFDFYDQILLFNQQYLIFTTFIICTAHVHHVIEHVKHQGYSLKQAILIVCKKDFTFF
jgi:hypothetical protein